MFTSSVVTILEIVALWKVFEKAGRKGWKSLIPVLNIYEYFEMGGVDGNMSLFALGAIIAGAIGGFSGVAGFVTGMGTDDGSGGSASILSLICILAAVALGIVYFVFYCKANMEIAKRFGHDTGFGIGLIFLNTIFVMILAFSSDTYNGTAVNGNARPMQPAQPMQPIQPQMQPQQQAMVQPQQPQMTGATQPQQPVNSENFSQQSYNQNDYFTKQQ